MHRRDPRLTRAISTALAPLLAGAFFLACSARTGAPGEATAETSQAASRAGQGVLHSSVTRDSWHRHPRAHHGFLGHELRCHPRPLALCPLFDQEFIGADGGAACARVTTAECPDRVDTWDNAIVFDFAVALTGDCRFGQWAPPLLSDTDVADYLNDLLAFTLQFFGCPEEGTDTKLTFGLIPAALQGHEFTTADLAVLVETYSAAVAQALSDNGSPPLTPEQAKALDAKLTLLARHVPNTVRSRNFTFSTCAPDSIGIDPADAVDDDLDCR